MLKWHSNFWCLCAEFVVFFAFSQLFSFVFFFYLNNWRWGGTHGKWICNWNFKFGLARKTAKSIRMFAGNHYVCTSHRYTLYKILVYLFYLFLVFFFFFLLYLTTCPYTRLVEWKPQKGSAMFVATPSLLLQQSVASVIKLPFAWQDSLNVIIIWSGSGLGCFRLVFIFLTGCG